MAAGDLTDAGRGLVGPVLPPERGRPGQPALDDRTVLDGISWRAPAGGPGAARRVEHGVAPLRPLAGPGLVRDPARRPRGERRGRGALAQARQHRHPCAPARGRCQGGRTVRRWAVPAAGPRPSSAARSIGLPRSAGRRACAGSICAALRAACRWPSFPRPLRRTRPAPPRNLVEDLGAGTRCPIGDTGCDADFVREPGLPHGILPVVPANPVGTAPAPLDRDLHRLSDRSSGW